jgi:FKBP-type peptidyl-prolyl cis-trans isomerase FkpA
MSRLVSIVCGVCLVVAGCGGNDSSGPTPSQPRAEFSQTDIRVGIGTAATTGRLLTVNYTGWLYDPGAAEQKGRQFDSSLSPGRTPFQFTLGAGGVIRGWDQGMAGARVGGLRRLVIPPELAYGAQGRSPEIPPNATLVFDIELLNVQ